MPERPSKIASMLGSMEWCSRIAQEGHVRRAVRGPATFAATYISRIFDTTKDRAEAQRLIEQLIQERDRDTYQNAVAATLAGLSTGEERQA